MFLAKAEVGSRWKSGDCSVFWPYPVRRRAVQINLEGRVWERTVEDQYDVPPRYASIMSMSTWKSFLVNCYRACVAGDATAISHLVDHRPSELILNRRHQDNPLLELCLREKGQDS